MADIERTYYAKLAVRDALCRDLENKREALLSEAASLNDTTMMVKRSLAETTWKAYQNLQTELISLCMNAEDIPELLSDGEYTSHIYVDILTVTEEGSIKREVKEEPDAVDQSLKTSMAVQLPSKEARINYQKIVNILFQFLEIKTIQVPDPNKIMDFVRYIQRDLMDLEKYDVGVQHWSPLVCAIMLRKLDKNTQQQWCKSEFRGAKPNHNSLIEFLSVYSQTLNPIKTRPLGVHPIVVKVESPSTDQNESSSIIDVDKDDNLNAEAMIDNDLRDTINRNALKNQSEISKSTRLCPLCPHGGMSHNVTKCAKFFARKWSYRMTVVKHNNLCIKCLVEQHSVDACKAVGKCSKCDKDDHHELMCNTLADVPLGCIVCKSDQHFDLKSCPLFPTITGPSRRQLIIAQKACFKCLGPFHKAMKCPNDVICANCQGKTHATVDCPNVNANKETATSLGPELLPANETGPLNNKKRKITEGEAGPTLNK